MNLDERVIRAVTMPDGPPSLEEVDDILRELAKLEQTEDVRRDEDEVLDVRVELSKKVCT